MTTEFDFKLEPDQELRFEVEENKDPAELKVIHGKAEIFGMELAINKTYVFPPGSKVAVYTWHGCLLKLKGNTEGTYTASETPMIMYMNAHACLERMRLDAVDGLSDEEFPKGPITMIVGPTNVGKSTLCQILVNYAVRMGRRPIYVDLDVGQGSIGVPGTIGAVLAERPITIEDGHSQDGALLYHFGHTAPSKNSTLYNILVSKIANCVHEKMAWNKKIGASGVIINTCGWTTRDGYKSLTHIAQSFEVDVILVLDQERLYNSLSRDITFIKVVFLPKSGGVVERSKTVRAKRRDERIKNYFYGRKTKCHPHVFEVKFNQIQVFKIGTTALPDSCLPADMKVEDHMTKIVPVEPGTRLKHSMLTLSQATVPEDLLTSNVKGFIVVVDVNEDRGTLTVLSPQPKPLPKCILVQSDILFMDSN